MNKKITHEQAREILNKIYYHCKDIPRQEDLEQYILQQERLENEKGEVRKRRERRNRK